MSSISEGILTAVEQVLRGITKANGYMTDFGNYMLIEEGAQDIVAMVSAGREPASNVIAEDEQQIEVTTFGSRTNTMGFVIEFATRDNFWLIIEDLKVALWADPTLGGACNDIAYVGWERQGVADASAALYGFRFRVEFREELGHPY